MKLQPTLRFLFLHPAHFIALGFGAGLSPWAPGTFGTLVAIPIALLLRAHAGDVEYLVAVAATFAVGVWASQVTGRALGAPDHGGIVVDEIAAFMLVLFFTGTTPWRIAIAFALFRFFDIVKPPPIRQLDASLKNGFGVMVDDLVAAGYALIVFAVGQSFAG
ncbi:MAG: phosphatidylglycerophosphatase A [Burkholderiales bacterium]